MTSIYLPQELIRKKRDGLALTDAEITFMVKGITNGQLSDAQPVSYTHLRAHET